MKDRFVITSTEGGVFNEVRILVDRETKVQYILATSGWGGGVTPLIDKDGKPILAEEIPE